MIYLRFCELRPTDFGIETIFEDGCQCSNWPHDNSNFQNVALQCGIKDTMQYTREHDLSHAFLAEKLFCDVSPVLWFAAHNLKDNLLGLYEERIIYHWQRYIRDIELPMMSRFTEIKDHYCDLIEIMGYTL